MRKLLISILSLSCFSAHADWQDCSEYATTIWLPPLALALQEKNPSGPKRLSEIVEAYRKRDSGKTLSEFKSLYNCTVMAAEPTTGNPGIWLYKFTEKQYGSTIEERIKNTPNAFMASLLGGFRKATTTDFNHCYLVTYWDERGANIKNDAFVLIESTKIPVPRVAACN